MVGRFSVVAAIVAAICVTFAGPAPCAADPADREADARLDADGFPRWPLFDDRAAADTLEAINRTIPVEFGDGPPPKPKKRPAKKPDQPRGEQRPRLEPLEFKPEFTEGEFANLPGGAFCGAVVGPNRKIYFIPFNSATVLVHSPDTGRTESITLPNGHVTEKYLGGVLGPNGCIYCVPFHHAAEIAVIDTKTHSVRMVFARSGGWKWRGGVVAGNGKAYFTPDQAGVVFTTDTVNGDVTVDLANNPPFPPSAFSGAAIGRDGRIYFAPLDARTCFRLDPRPQGRPPLADKVEIFGNAPGGHAYDGATVGPDGRIYCIPHHADHVLVIDPAGPAATPLQLPGNTPIAGRHKFSGGVLGPDGNIYCIPNHESRILVIETPRGDKTSATLRYWGGIVRGKDGKPEFREYRAEKPVVGAYFGGVLGPDGRIYFVPHNAKHLLAIGQKQPINMNRVLSPMFNKL